MNNPTLGRSYTTRMSQADSDVPNRGVDVYSHPRRACYLQGSLSDSLCPHQQGLQSSLRPTFVSAFHAFRNTVSLAFVVHPLLPISDRDELSIGRPCFLIEGVPPQPNYPPDAVPLRVSNTKSTKWCNTFAYPYPGRHGITAPTYSW